jgi:hypothetical protein
MRKIDTRIKNKEQTILKTIDKVKTLEQQMKGLEEARLFCSINRKDVLRNGRCNIRCDLDIYKYWNFCPDRIGGDNENGVSWAVLFPDVGYFTDENETVVCLSKERLLFFEKYYQQMCERLFAEIEIVKRKLNSLYAEYGRLIYSYKTGIEF